MNRKICQECKIEIHQEVKSYNGEEKMSWRNPDGSPHFYYEDGKFIHTPTQFGYFAVILKEINSKLDAVLKVIS